MIKLAHTLASILCLLVFNIHVNASIVEHENESLKTPTTSNIMDTTPPVITIVEPSLVGYQDGDNVYIECDALVEMNSDGATATDDIDGDVPVVFMEMPGENADCLTDGYLAHMICGWKATDAAGNQSQILLNFYIIDNTPPMLFGIPDDVTLDCIDDLTTPVNIGAMDNCDLEVTTEMTETSSGSACNQTIIRKWTTTDHCGNMTMQSQTIQIIDNVPPVIYGAPADITTDCYHDLDNLPVLTVIDNCDDDVALDYEVSEVGDQCEKIILRKWTATDNCGNQSQVSQTIFIKDEENPVFTNTPSNMNIECVEDLTTPTLTATDNCDDNVNVTLQETQSGSGCQITIQRIWTATDDCGNQSQTSQIVYVNDNQAPQFTNAPNDINLECIDDLTTPATPTATDNCDDNVNINYEESQIGTNCDLLLLRKWTATDNCGNQTQISQTVYINDNEAPQFTSTPSDITVNCDEIPYAATLTATDNCTNNVSIDYNQSTVANGCNDYYMIRTWTATDECGNTTTHSQRVTIIDNDAPVFTTNIAPVINADCSAIPQASDIIAIDNCSDNVSVTITETSNGSDCSNMQIIRTYTATDDCGNANSVTQTINVIDNENPVLQGVPNDITVECNAIPTNAHVTVTDNCSSDLEINTTETIANSICEDSYTIIRTWMATDYCGNSVSASQQITVEDNTPPVFIGVPNDTLINCSTAPSPPIIGQGIKAVDLCDTSVEITLAEQTLGEDCSNMQIIRTWTAVDNCGNTTTASQTITLVDEIAPVFTYFPNDVEFDCEIGTLTDTPIATDNCGENVQITYEDVQVDLACGYIIFRTYIATDNCGNSTEQIQKITVRDLIAPIISGVPSDLTLECHENIPSIQDVTVTDNCDNPTISIEEQIIPGACEHEYTIIRVYTASDACGNNTTQEQTIVVQDDTAPSISFTHPAFENVVSGQTIYLECENGIPNMANYTVIEDNCDPNPSIVFNEDTSVSNDCSQDGYIIQLQCEWQITDDCGNTTYFEFTIVVSDTAAPTLVCQEDISVTLGDAIPEPIEPTISDNCTDNFNVSFTENEISNNEECSRTLIRTWTTSDECGNVSSCEQNVFVEELCECPEVIITSSEVTPSDCGQSNGTFTANITAVEEYNLLLIPAYGNANEIGNAYTDLPVGEYLFIAEHPDFDSCEMKQFFTITEDCGADCEIDVFTADSIALEVATCYDKATICLNIQEQGTNQYDILLNGSPYTDEFVGCSFDTVYTYATGIIPNAGLQGTYTLNSWTINGEAHSTTFENIQELLESINAWDNNSWALTPSGFVGGNAANTYGNMNIVQNSTSISVSLVTNTNINATGVALSVPVGEHNFAITNSMTGCSDNAHISVLCPSQARQLPVAYDDEITTNQGDDISIDACLNDSIYGAITRYEVTSTPTTGFISMEGNIIRYEPLPDNCDDINFTYEVCNELGCDEGMVRIYYLCDEISVFTGFSPNGDGINDAFRIDGLARYPNHKISIFNRWGNKVLYTENYQNDWRGTHNGQDLPDGTYFYLFDNGEGDVSSGWISLKR